MQSSSGSIAIKRSCRRASDKPSVWATAASVKTAVIAGTFRPPDRPGEDSTREPVPGKRLVEALGRVLSDAAQHVSEPGLRIDVVEFGRHDQRRDGGSPIGAALGAGEEP